MLPNLVFDAKTIIAIFYIQGQPADYNGIVEQISAPGIEVTNLFVMYYTTGVILNHNILYSSMHYQQN